MRGDEDEVTDIEEDWSEREDWSIFLAQGMWWYFYIYDIEDKPTYCECLDSNNLCSIWMDDEEFKPICRYWPMHPSHIEKFEGCGFKFERIAE